MVCISPRFLKLYGYIDFRINMRSFTVNRNDGEQRLDKFISKTLRGIPTSLMYKYIRTKRIKVNGKRAHEKDILQCGDVVEMYIPDEFFGEDTGKNEFDRVKHFPEIVYEDDNILLADKKPGVLVHTGDEGDPNRDGSSERETLIFALQAYLYQKGEYNPAEENSFAPALCNRIDRNTGGIVILAKNAAALREINEAIRDGRVHKKYLCAVHGHTPYQDTLKGYLSKDYRTKTVTVTEKKQGNGREIITLYRRLDYCAEHDLSLLEVTLVTGRTHQIRAHMEYAGFPLLGEGKYGVNREDRKLGFRGQALYSYRVSFTFDSDTLGYLNGKEFTVNTNNVKFLRFFENYNLRHE